MVLHKPYYAVQNPKLEIDPWAPSAAELLNKYIPDMESAERLTDGMAALSVIMGLGGMIAARVQMDGQVARQARLDAARAQREAYIEQEHRIDPDRPATAPQGASSGHSPNGQHSGGAKPTSPGKIEGLGGSVF